MKRFLSAVLILIAVAVSLSANEQKLTGVWESIDGKIRYDILDGFSPNKGVVIAYETGQESDLGSWVLSGDVYGMVVGWFSGTISFIEEDIIQYRNKVYKRIAVIDETGAISIKTDEQAFIEKLIGSTWLDDEENLSILFHRTFSLDAGVVEKFHVVKGNLDEFETWSIGSGVLKMGYETYVDARVSDKFLILLNQYDRFVVYEANGGSPLAARTDLQNQREAFLTALTTDAWYTVDYTDVPTIHRFRPIESELKGRVIETRDNVLGDWGVWEYSPQTGALEIDYSTYVGGLLIGETLALITSSGNQDFYRRLPGGAQRRFTLGDVTALASSETNVAKIAALLDGQFQSGDYLYRFEFNPDNLSGYVHTFDSQPFTITGNRMLNTLLGTTERLWAVEEVVIFDEDQLLRRDTRQSRLRPISDDEARELQIEDKAALQTNLNKNVVVRVRTKDGQTYEMDFPVTDFSEIADLSLVVE